VAAFEAVCQALAYAHAHGVIHRDLKPANVMVGAFGEVQVMDWGLAKVLSARPAHTAEDPLATTPGTAVRSLRDNDALFTQAGSILGTPAFMPPEQAIGAIDQIDARSDVFGLGGVLVAILTGQPPFQADTAESSRQLAAQGKVLDCFARLDRCGADPALVALCKRCLSPGKGDRPAEAGEVAKAVAALRAAADERARRAELDKVRVEGEQAAAEARALERRKRRRLGLGAAAALVLAVLGGLGAVLFVQRRANADLTVKNIALAEEQAKVQARFELAQKAIATFHTGVSEDLLLKNPQFQALQTKLLKEAAGFYGDLEQLLAGQTDPRSRHALAAAYSELGGLTEKIGSQADALAVHRRALALRRELAAAPGADVEARLEVARSLRSVANLLDATGDTAGALTAYGELRELAAGVAAEAPTGAAQALLAAGHTGAGGVLSDTGKPGEALKAYEQARDILRKVAEANPADTEVPRDLAGCYENIGVLLWKTGKPADALQAYEKAQNTYKKLAQGNPAVTKFQDDLAKSYGHIALLLADTGKPGEALQAYEKELDIRRKLVKANPAVTNLQSSLAATLHNMAMVQANTGRTAEALKGYEQAVAIQKALVEANPAVTQFQTFLANHYTMLGDVLSQTGKPEEALQAFEKARDIRRKLAEANPTVTALQSSLAQILNGMAWVQARMGRTAEALKGSEQARDICRKLAEANPTIPEYQDELATSHDDLGWFHARLKQFPEAFTALDAGLAIRRKLADAHPTITKYSNALASSYTYRGWAHVLAGQPAEAAGDLRRAIELWAKDPAPPMVDRFEHARALALLAGLAGDAQSGVPAAEATAFRDQAVAALRDAVKAGWSQADELKEPYFDALRKRDDFQELVKGLAVKAAAGDQPKSEKRPAPPR
jgi:tetratricopeptide (TPR) repeat protein